MSDAFGYLGLLPDEFWSLTPREFRNMMDGYKKRQDGEWQRTAQLASWIMAAQLGKKAPTADKLLGKDNGKQRPQKVVSLEEKRRTLAELEESLVRAVN